MSDRTFLDTNVLVYAYDCHDPGKQRQAQQVLHSGLADDTAVLSAQVLGEFFVTVTRKIPTPLTCTEARDIVDLISILDVVDVDRALTKRAIQTHERYGISYWDALIVAAAERGRCVKVLSEDLQHGQTIHGILIENPFLPATGG